MDLFGVEAITENQAAIIENQGLILRQLWLMLKCVGAMFLFSLLVWAIVSLQLLITTRRTRRAVARLEEHLGIGLDCIGDTSADPANRHDPPGQPDRLDLPGPQG